jgi:nanoRNase/pAp phosphatase (c-di-AMP/oligoRNAs hydrolase)
MNNIQQIKRPIRKARVILISGHTNPDGDSIGSLLSLGLGLRGDSAAEAIRMWPVVLSLISNVP